MRKIRSLDRRCCGAADSFASWWQHIEIFSWKKVFRILWRPQGNMLLLSVFFLHSFSSFAGTKYMYRNNVVNFVAFFSLHILSSRLAEQCSPRSIFFQDGKKRTMTTTTIVYALLPVVFISFRSNFITATFYGLKTKMLLLLHVHHECIIVRFVFSSCIFSVCVELAASANCIK